jgi:hypothetical protein
VYGAVPPRRIRFLALALVGAALAGTGCGDDGSASSACDQPVREELDPASLTHVIDPADARFTTNPPTSGPHVSGALPTGVVDEPIPGAVQVAVLEGGNVLVQYRDLSDADRTEVEAFAGDQVVVAPNPDLPAPVVATAWTYKLTCDALDVDAVETFIADHAGAAVNH